ncbi:MAG: DNA cytosine methyltransferase [Acidobacteriota bacterium]|nr:DNA cytosine methyltransferase [Acidobacteriota bacterium]
MKTILSLCDYTGNWAKPWAENGWEVVQVDIQHGQDVILLPHLNRRVDGILAAPPCTHFARSGAQYWESKGEAALREGLAVVDACLRAVAIYNPRFWALENPIGRLKDFLGEPTYKFDPCDFGDPWTKRTWLWGRFVVPMPLWAPQAERVTPTMGDITTKGSNCKNRRSATPMGFSLAFYQANHAA